jgi:hypothetical protein
MLKQVFKGGFFFRSNDWAVWFCHSECPEFIAETGLFQEFTCYQITWVIFKAEAYRCGHANGIVLIRLVRKVTSFLLYSKGRKLACIQVGYPDWKLTLTLSLAPSFPSYWCKIFKELRDVNTCWFAHTQSIGHMIYVSCPVWLQAQGEGERKEAEKLGSSSW